MSSTDAFLASVVTEILLTALARLRTDGPPAVLRIGSPWLSDAPLFPGIFAGSFPFLLPGVAPNEVGSIGAFIGRWTREGGTATVLVQSYDPGDWPRKGHARNNELELQLLERCLDVGAEVLLGRRFHDKFVLVPDVVVSGSANVTYSGFYLNRERMSVHNRSSASVDFSSSEAVCNNHLAGARAAGSCRPRAKPVGVVDLRSIEDIRKFYRSSWT